MQDGKLKPVCKVEEPSFITFCKSIWTLPTEFDECLTYAEQMQFLMRFLRDQIIPCVNNNGDAVKELQENFVMFSQAVQDEIKKFEEATNKEIKSFEDFVNAYFDNLDVQAEINKKLDEFAKDGTLDNLLNNYLDVTKVYDTAEMAELDKDTFVQGMKIKTLGFYEINDGGGADYWITGVQDGTKYQVNLGNGLYAEMIIKNNTVNVNQVGCKGDGVFDNSEILQALVNKCMNTGWKIVFDCGEYRVKTPIQLNYLNKDNAKLRFISGQGYHNWDRKYNTVIVGENSLPYQGIFNFKGRENTFGASCTLENIAIVQDKTCDKTSFCIYLGDSRNFEMKHVKLWGYNDLFIASGSTTYEHIDNVYDQCDFRLFEEYEKGFAILHNNILDNENAHLDYINITNTRFEGPVCLSATLGNISNCEFGTRLPQTKPKTTENIGRLNGIEIDYSSGILVGQGSLVIQENYFEDVRRCVHVLMLEDTPDVEIKNNFFNIKMNTEGVYADYAVLIEPSNVVNGASRDRIGYVNIHDNYFHEGYPWDGNGWFRIASVENKGCAKFRCVGNIIRDMYPRRRNKKGLEIINKSNWNFETENFNQSVHEITLNGEVNPTSSDHNVAVKFGDVDVLDLGRKWWIKSFVITGTDVKTELVNLIPSDETGTLYYTLPLNEYAFASNNMFVYTQHDDANHGFPNLKQEITDASKLQLRLFGNFKETRHIKVNVTIGF